MRRLAFFAATFAMCAASAHASGAAEAQTYLSWPGKAASQPAPTRAAPAPAEDPGALTLSKTFSARPTTWPPRPRR